MPYTAHSEKKVKDRIAFYQKHGVRANPLTLEEFERLIDSYHGTTFMELRLIATIQKQLGCFLGVIDEQT